MYKKVQTLTADSSNSLKGPTNYTYSDITNDVAFLALNSTGLPSEEWPDFYGNMHVPSKTSSVTGTVGFGCAMMFPFGFCNSLLAQVVGPVLLDEDGLDFFFIAKASGYN